MEIKWETVGNLEPHQLKLFQESSACKAACQKIVEEVTKHYEDAYIQKAVLWNELKKKYDSPEENWVLNVDHASGEVKRLDRKTYEVTQDIRKHEKKLAFKKFVEDKFNEE